MTSFQITADPLRSELVSLATLLTQRGIILTVGGGYGLVLKREYVMSRNLRTRFQDPPYVRSTNDVDLFLTADLIVDGETTRVIREALEVLGYDLAENPESKIRQELWEACAVFKSEEMHNSVSMINMIE